MPIRFWPDGAAVVSRCHCGGELMLVEDLGAPRPVEAQCATCLELTGLPHDAVKVSASAPASAIVPGSVEDLGF